MKQKLWNASAALVATFLSYEACARVPVPYSGMTPDEMRASHLFVSTSGRELRVTFSSKPEFSNQDNELIVDTEYFPKEAQSLKLCLESPLGVQEFFNVRMLNCCGRTLPGPELIFLPGTQCYTLQPIIFPNNNYRLHVLFNSNENSTENSPDIAIFDRFFTPRDPRPLESSQP